MTAKHIAAVIDLQFGSTGKGQVAGTIAHHWKPDTVATAWGPNAGHTFRHEDFEGVSRMLASSAIAPSVNSILIGPGSVVDLDMLTKEIEDRAHRLHGKTLVIHPQAAILQPNDAFLEKTLVRIGSTMKGTAEAAIRKMRREEDAVAAWQGINMGRLVEACREAQLLLYVSSFYYDEIVDRSKKLIVEGAQGFSLGLHTDFYPRTTSRDVSTAQLFADCRLPFPGNGSWPRIHIIGVCRTFPIRVANRAVEDHTYSSGGHYPDQHEMQWGELGRKAELTTVTQLPRRLFSFSYEQIRQAVRVCNPSHLALTFCDYLPEKSAPGFAENVETRVGRPVSFMSFGPKSSDIMRRTPLMLKPLLQTECNYLGGVEYDGY